MTSTAETVLEARSVSKTYPRNKVHALEDVDLTLREGSFTSVIGPSGCGKSTLLKIAAGLVPATGGEVVIHGERVTAPRTDVGMMFQEATLLPWLTATKNVLLPLEIQGGTHASSERRELAHELLELVQLNGFEDAYPSELSGGMAQRVAICRMLITQPSLLLLDEPFGALDELTRERMNDELQRIVSDRDATALMITHSVAEAVYLSDAVVVMSPRPGRIADTIEIDLPRPRDPETLTTPRYAELVKRVRDHLDLGAQL